MTFVLLFIIALACAPMAISVLGLLIYAAYWVFIALGAVLMGTGIAVVTYYIGNHFYTNGFAGVGEILAHLNPMSSILSFFETATFPIDSVISAVMIAAIIAAVAIPEKIEGLALKFVKKDVN